MNLLFNIISMCASHQQLVILVKRFIGEVVTYNFITFGNLIFMLDSRCDKIFPDLVRIKLRHGITMILLHSN